MYSFVDENKFALNKEQIDNLFRELNKELRKKLRKHPSWYKVELYVVGGACMVAAFGSRESTMDVDAVWTVGDLMRDCINTVGDHFGYGHSWCNCDFKRTNSYTDKIAYNSWVYMEFDRLIVRMVNIDLLLAMKLVAFREYKVTDMQDCYSIINRLKSSGVVVDSSYLFSVTSKYFSQDKLSSNAIRFIRSFE